LQKAVFVFMTFV